MPCHQRLCCYQESVEDLRERFNGVEVVFMRAADCDSPSAEDALD